MEWFSSLPSRDMGDQEGLAGKVVDSDWREIVLGKGASLPASVPDGALLSTGML